MVVENSVRFLRCKEIILRIFKLFRRLAGFTVNHLRGLRNFDDRKEFNEIERWLHMKSIAYSF